jgi:ankyrin repeat protein
MDAQSASLAALSSALAEGDPANVAALIAAGADLRYTREDGYDALIDAVHGRDILLDDRLLDLLRLLIANGVDLNRVTKYAESGLRVLSWAGRFDGVQLLLDAGADERLLEWTPLIRAVALGSLQDVEEMLDSGAPLEAVDWWSRTAFLVALLAGDVNKVEVLVRRGANVDARGRCGQPPLSYAAHGRPHVVKWLIEHGQSVDQTDEFGGTPLMKAVEWSDLPCVDLLIQSGADVNRDLNGSVLGRARSRDIACRLLDAGADPAGMTNEARRALLGFAVDPDECLLVASTDEFRRACSPRFGTSNPERIQEPFWESMIRSGVNAYAARRRYDSESLNGGSCPSPATFERRIEGAQVFCAQRFGQSVTFLPDGRIVEIGGEHEDFYDPDFCIYNDVFVHAPDGAITIFGYPEVVFPPTDFHTATLLDDHIYTIGSLGYLRARRPGVTPVYRLDLHSFRMEVVTTRGDAPGWIHGHRAILSGSEIRVSGGMVAVVLDGRSDLAENSNTFVLDLASMIWRREAT